MKSNWELGGKKSMKQSGLQKLNCDSPNGEWCWLGAESRGKNYRQKEGF